MTAADERSIPAPANQARADREAVRSSLANSSAPSSTDAAFAPQPSSSWELRTPGSRVRRGARRKAQGPQGSPPSGVWEDLVGHPRFSQTWIMAGKVEPSLPPPLTDGATQRGTVMNSRSHCSRQSLGPGSLLHSPLPCFAPCSSCCSCGTGANSQLHALCGGQGPQKA